MTENAPSQFGIHESWITIDGDPLFEEPSSDDTPFDPLLRNWLLNTGSLTERLQANCHKFAVQLLGQQEGDISKEESQFLYGQFGDAHEKTQVREVFLTGNSANWVFARSLLPCSFLDNEMDELTHLGTKPLGKIIFNDPRFVRQGFQLVECPVKCKTLRNLNIVSKHACWGRRSLFQFKSYRIMVAEIFLPDSPAYRNYQS